MDACKNNHTVIRKRKDQVYPIEERVASTATILDPANVHICM
jgi:hypothetical protein